MTPTIIDKLAFIEIQNRKVLVSMTKGKDRWYIPGGKREAGETDLEALAREVKEELNVDIDSSTAQLFGIFEAQAHGRPEGTIVRMTCYTTSFQGTLTPSSEIDKLDFFTFDQRHLCAPVDNLIFTELKARNLID